MPGDLPAIALALALGFYLNSIEYIFLVSTENYSHIWMSDFSGLIMKKEIITVKTYYYLPWRFVWALVLIGGAVVLLISERWILGSCVLLLAALVLTSHYGIRVNLKEKTYNDFLSHLGFINGEEKKFEKIDYLILKSSKKSYAMNSQITSKSFTDDYYDGYIKFDGNESVYLLSNKNKTRVTRKLEELSTQLDVKIIDQSE